jgi:NAD(P)-dependent dehydrogenase (short-subunit alcohol dehydrogenase family)
MVDLELAGKSVVITGGASNIGRAIVLQFAEEGANITIGDIDQDSAEAVAAVAKKKGAADAQVIPTDVTDLYQVETMFNAATTKYGTVDVLVNNVGWDRLMFFTQTTPDFWDKVVQLNYIGMLNCCKMALPIMIPQNSGSIVSISSDASRQGESREAVYGGIKAAINSVMKTLGRENGRYGIRCNAVCPGVTIPADDEIGHNSMWTNKGTMFTPEQLERVAKALPLKKVGRPQDVANAVVFLSSAKRAGHITGQVLSVSGGYSMVG